MESACLRPLSLGPEGSGGTATRPPALPAPGSALEAGRPPAHPGGWSQPRGQAGPSSSGAGSDQSRRGRLPSTPAPCGTNRDSRSEWTCRCPAARRPRLQRAKAPGGPHPPRGPALHSPSFPRCSKGGKNRQTDHQGGGRDRQTDYQGGRRDRPTDGLPGRRERQTD